VGTLHFNTVLHLQIFASIYMFVIVSGQTSPLTFCICADPCELLNFEHGGEVEKGLCRTSGAFSRLRSPRSDARGRQVSSAKLLRLASQVRTPRGTSSLWEATDSASNPIGYRGSRGNGFRLARL
jgi:hypothetical protein